jgi:hypothetical protein
MRFSNVRKGIESTKRISQEEREDTWRYKAFSKRRIKEGKGGRKEGEKEEETEEK